MRSFREIHSNKDASKFLNDVLWYFKNLGEDMIPPLLIREYKADHEKIKDLLNHVVAYLNEEEN